MQNRVHGSLFTVLGGFRVMKIGRFEDIEGADTHGKQTPSLLNREPLELSHTSSCFSAFSDDLDHFVCGDMEVDALDIQRGILTRLRPDHENLAVLTLYSNLSFLCRLFQ
jgi:hypothetical protein